MQYAGARGRAASHIYGSYTHAGVQIATKCEGGTQRLRQELRTAVGNTTLRHLGDLFSSEDAGALSK